MTFTVTVHGLGPIVSPALITDQTGTSKWKVTITGATPGLGTAAALVATGDGNQIPASPVTLTTT